MQGIYDPASEKFLSTYDEVEYHLENDAQRHIIRLRSENDGRLTVRGHSLADTGGN